MRTAPGLGVATASAVMMEEQAKKNYTDNRMLIGNVAGGVIVADNR